MNNQDLRTLISERIDIHWSDFSTRHPHLADAIDRIRLVDSAVDLVRDDPQFVSAMHGADLDEARLADATKLLGLMDQLVQRLLPG